MKNRMNHIAAAVISVVLAAQGIPMQGGIYAADGDILVTDFEDGDVSGFSKRGDTDTSVIEATTEDAHSGKTCMAVTERSEGWNGPSVSLAAAGCEPGVQYIASAWVKMQWYNTVNLSMQYTDAAGDQHYNNLCSVQSDGGWVQIPETKFSFSEDMKDVSIYIEGSDKANMWVDDFTLKAAPIYKIQDDVPGLKDVYKNYFKIGGAVTAGELAPKSTKDLILKHYNSITVGNELKPENMLDKKATLAYLEETGDNTTPQVSLNGSARMILNFCRDNKIPVRGHVLVWHSQTPTWFFTKDYTDNYDADNWVDKETMLKRMEAYIKGVFAVLSKEYPDVDFYAWDVVNEAWTDGGEPRKAGKYEDYNESSAWVTVFGDNSFIEPAFEYARKYAPASTKLYYNDYNEYIQGKTDAIIKMATELKSKDLIDGIGLQSHLNVTNNKTSEPFPTVGIYESALKKFTELGLDIQITELDATADHEVKDWEKLQAKYYGDLFKAIRKYRENISAVVFWGTTDDQSWRADRTPLLFDAEYQTKPSFDAIIEGMDYTIEPAATTAPPAATTTAPATTTTAAPAATTTAAPVTTTAAETTVQNGTTTTLPTGALLRGDVNGNGDVDVSDAVLLAKYLAEDTDANLSAEGKRNADIDGKGLDMDDVTSILKAIAKLITL